MCTLVPSLLCFNSGFASAIITGGILEVAAAFNTSEEVRFTFYVFPSSLHLQSKKWCSLSSSASIKIVNASVCLFVVGFGIGPLFWAPLSESEFSLDAGAG